ncbi:hypothetical protein GCM10023339_32090 [Alloalcanivorax gelatiniphagus]
MDGFTAFPEGRRALSRLAVIFRATGSTEPPPPPWYIVVGNPERFRYLEAALCGWWITVGATGRHSASVAIRSGAIVIAIATEVAPT